MAVGVRADRGEVLLAGLVLRQVAAEPLQPALDRVHVRVGEAGRQQAAVEVDDADVGPGPAEWRRSSARTEMIRPSATPTPPSAPR